MKTIYLCVVWIFELLYVGLTICYLIPDNPLKASAKVPLQYFEDVFYQNWSFFAPPPTNELRVYLLIDEDDSKPNSKNLVLDLTTRLSEEKRQAFPFSWRENFNEYVLGGAAQGQVRGRAKIEQRLLTIDEFANLEPEEITKLRRNLAKGHDEIRSTKTLKSYCLKVAAATGVELAASELKRMRYAIVAYDYPKYIDRYNKNYAPKMSLHYISDLF